MKLKKLLLLLFLSYLHSFHIEAQSLKSSGLDVLEYHVHLEPFFSKNTIEGSVSIKFKTSTQTEKVVFDSGELTVTKLEGKHTKGFTQKGKKTTISLFPNENNIYEIKLHYNGSPKKGLVFLDNSQKLYTVYFTSEWMICNAAPDDRATIKLDLLVPKETISVASGNLKGTNKIGDKIKYSWHQNYETPAYTYGFTVGSFNTLEKEYNGIALKYYSADYSKEELKQIFQYTENMMKFFEEKTGITFPQKAYSQILIGNHYQEMSGFAILRKSYGKLVLKDSTETNLISHELAHQWWGNMITCKNWKHFWLNEGFATFMSAAYNEYKFGTVKYQADINSYKRVYEKIKSKGRDKPLVFKRWLNPSGDDRNIVYFKGAYVLHLLRKELGEEAFWSAIKYYTQTYYGKSVTTKDFQLAMEKSSGRSLENFFKKWIY
ncbi:M1 family aminopeptidase [Aquimarina sp. 2201CG5-10]|uniref:M1 family aminopeptidase n=1 Tax=Aquimarina callyspongiae TaxID=3098150 RepID=UPI002AB41C79|nr:M1 family aminopeptidase [Aquimarina sp. 2201CG5-10]MDY8137496.1 M1 family aminopeptidase [Aquimarina sp. 2201CG5-10]